MKFASARLISADIKALVSLYEVWASLGRWNLGPHWRDPSSLAAALSRSPGTCTWTERDLHDIGVSRIDIAHELEKPFWRA